MINVLIAEDSKVIQELIAGILNSAPGIRVAGIAQNGIEAVEMACSLRPDIITMDIRMPKLDGFEATKRIMKTCPTPIIIVSASLAKDMDSTFAAVKAGALTVIDKPHGVTDAAYESTRSSLVNTIKLMAAVKVVRRWHDDSPKTPRLIMHNRHSAQITTKIVAIGASTGGPTAISMVLKQLPKKFGVPIIIVQHITPGFGTAFADWLAAESGVSVQVPRNGTTLLPNQVYLAPDDCHMGVSPSGRIMLGEQSNFNHHKPSINHMFESVANAFGPEAVGVLLTGMGDDGAAGLRQLRVAGGRTIAQDEASSIVFGMPKAAIELEAADQVVPLSEIAKTILSLSS